MQLLVPGLCLLFWAQENSAVPSIITLLLQGNLETSPYENGVGEITAPTAPDNPFDDPSADLGLEFEPEIAFETAAEYEDPTAEVQQAPTAAISFEEPAARQPSMAYEQELAVDYETSRPRPSFEATVVAPSYETPMAPVYESDALPSIALKPPQQSVEPNVEPNGHQAVPFREPQAVYEQAAPQAYALPQLQQPAKVNTSPLLSQTSGDQPLSARIEHDLGSPESSQRWKSSADSRNHRDVNSRLLILDWGSRTSH